MCQNLQGIQPLVLIFVQSKECAKELFHELIYDGINVHVIHADRTQLQFCFCVGIPILSMVNLS